MPTIVAAIAVLTALVLLNLLLTFGVIRRLREHSEQLAANAPTRTIPVGATVPEFSATSERGDAVSTATLRGDGRGGTGALVAFMAPDCPACAEQLPAVRERLATAVGGPTAVLVVFTRLRAATDPGDKSAAELAEALGVAGGPAVIVHEPLDGTLQTTFQVAAFPAFYLVDPDGKVAAASNGITDLPVPPQRSLGPVGPISTVRAADPVAAG
ncbi:peroxiredoxin family protein [Phytohabitans aurantiacus]|uniref:TlpA family protein n=1 Tax=Phytohabitans aurantiacus TaxID=3016789 RepID=A0ABQ5R933_9ACTN|nr:redoxin domain-containing protein [Phytohabitans aurantiacus]GLI02893.1 TlpA family protein [Phytohabitans aurantiacus]